MAQLVKYLLCKSEDLGLLPRMCVRQPGFVAHTSDSSSAETQAGRCLGLASLEKCTSSRLLRDHISKLRCTVPEEDT